jgi:hypothetical protein
MTGTSEEKYKKMNKKFIMDKKNCNFAQLSQLASTSEFRNAIT